ncbi:MAG: GxxExxY protein [Kiritimatiellales bacterium]
MNTNIQLEEDELVYRIIGCSMEVLNEIGHGLREKTYERALCREFDIQGVTYSQQAVFPVEYKGAKIDEYIPDLIVEARIVTDAKTIDGIGPDEVGKMLNYLKITKLKVGLIINFKHAKLE